MLEVAYASKIMSKNFRREGQPEKERISQATGIELDKVSCKLSNFTGVSFIYIRLELKFIRETEYMIPMQTILPYSGPQVIQHFLSD